MKKYTQLILESRNNFMDEAIALAKLSIQRGGGPFGCVIVKDGKIIGRGHNKVTMNNDPTAHAEITAIREACRTLNTFQLTGCEIYTSCYPCPMCWASIYWAKLDKVYYALNQHDAANAGFDDIFIYQELSKPMDKRKIPFFEIMRDDAKIIFDDWENKTDKIEY